MSTSGSQSSFVPTRDVADILETLREVGVPSLADEIELAIQQGRDVQRTRSKAERHGKLPAKYTEVSPFDDNEQEAILITALHRYFTELPDCFIEAQKQLQLSLSIDKGVTGPLEIRITRPGSDDPLPLFNPQFEGQRRELEDHLRKAWPLKTEVFEIP